MADTIESLQTGGIRFLVYDAITKAGIPSAKIYTSINRITWYYRGYTDNYGSLYVPGLPIGTNYYLASKTGYNVASGSINVVANILVNAYVWMTRTLSTINEVATGSLTITSMPEDAMVCIDDIVQAYSTPVTITGIPEGDHVLTLIKNGYDDYVTIVTIMRGETSSIMANLVPLR